MKILHLSDTHGLHRKLTKLPMADIAVHSGDFCMAGTESEAIDFLNWFCDLPYRHKIFICGNHDEALYSATLTGIDENVHYLCNSSAMIDGVKFYGVPLFMGDCIAERQDDFYTRIPDDTEVLITHTPPYCILDYDDDFHYGSEALAQRIKELKLRAHLFGHIHRQNGVQKQDKTIFSNASIMDESYNAINTPNIIEI